MTKPVITRRDSKSSPLTYNELDNNFTNLQNATLNVTANSTPISIDLNGSLIINQSGTITVTGDSVNKSITIGGGGVPAFANITSTGQTTLSATSLSDTVAIEGTNGIAITTSTTSIAPIVLTAHGNAQISTAQYKVGTASIYFDGTGDYITMTNSTEEAVWNTSDFTIELYVRMSALSTQGYTLAIGDMDPVGTTNYWAFGVDDGARVKFTYNNGTVVGVASALNSVSLNTWTHVAMTYKLSTNTITIYKDGTQVAQSTVSGTPVFSPAINLVLGGFNNYSLNGYVDELRVSNTLRYTGAFTPSTTAFTTDANTLLLLHAEGTNGSTTFTNDVATVTGTKSLTIAETSVGTAGTYTGKYTTNAQGRITSASNSLVGYDEGTIYNLGTTGGTIAPNVANGNVQKITLNSALTFNGFTSPIAGQSLTLIVYGGTAYTSITSTMKFAGGNKYLTATANCIDIVNVYYDGTTYFATIAKGFA